MDDAELVHLLRCGYGAVIKLTVEDFKRLDALASRAATRIESLSAVIERLKAQNANLHGTIQQLGNEVARLNAQTIPVRSKHE